MSPEDSVDRIQKLEARLAELERHDELKSQFISLASHELRTPIAVVQGIAATLHLCDDQLAPEQRSELRQTLYLQSCRLGELTEQLLDLSRLDSEALVLSPARFHPRERIEELLTRIAPDRLDEVEVGVEPRLQLYTDPNAFERVVANLLTNALHYGAPPIEVRAQPARQVDFVVEDHGARRSRRVRPAPLRAVLAGVRRRGSPTGGRPRARNAKSFATALGGDLRYEPAQPTGARFCFELPRELAA